MTGEALPTFEEENKIDGTAAIFTMFGVRIFIWWFLLLFSVLNVGQIESDLRRVRE